MIEEKNIQVNNSKNKSKIIIIISIIMLLIGGALLLCKGVFNKNNNQENNEEKDNEMTVDENILSTYPYLLVETAKYGATEESKNFIDELFGDNAEEKFNTYFQWFNVTHELTHGMITYNSDLNYYTHMLEYSTKGYIEEQHVNDFVVAFWKKYGDPEKVQLLKETIEYVVSKLEDPTNGTMDLEEYAKKLWEQDNPDSSFEEYGWFQFNSVKLAFDKDLSFEEAFNNLGIKTKVNFDEDMLTYTNINESVCDQIVLDVAAKFKKWGLNYPEIYHIYSDDPNSNYSNSLTKAQYESLINNK